jgi:hypothetical protein
LVSRYNGSSSSSSIHVCMCGETQLFDGIRCVFLDPIFPRVHLK